MKIKIKRTPTPSNYDTRRKTKFLWFPVYDWKHNQYRWMEFANVQERYVITGYGEYASGAWEIQYFVENDGTLSPAE